MLMTMLKSKLHQLRITRVDLEYEGSLLVDEALLAAAGMRNFEKILVANLENGERFETYAIAGKAGSRDVCLNGAAAHKGKTGDRLIVMAWGLVDAAEAASHRPQIVRLDADNRPLAISPP